MRAGRRCKAHLADLFEACDHSKRGGLTAAERTNENDELLVFDVQAEICNSGNAAGIDFIDILSVTLAIRFSS